MYLGRFFLIGFLIGLFLAPGIFATHESDFETEGLKIAENFGSFLDKRVDETIEVANFDYSDIEVAKNSIRDFYADHNSEIWFNLGSDNFPIEKKKVIPIYRDIVFIGADGKEIIKYSEDGFSDNLLDVSVQENTEFKSEVYFEDTKGLDSGEVFIGKVLTWYVGFDDVFEGASVEAKEGKIYEEVIGRDILKQGVIRFSSPVYRDGVFKGVVVLSLDYRHLQELFKHIEPARDEIVISSTYARNYLLVFDLEGNTIFHPKPDNVLGYLEDGQLAGFNEPNSTREGSIFNLYKYRGSFAYSEMARQVLEDKETFVSYATDVGGRTKVTLAVPVLYSNPNTNYEDVGVFGGIMLSIQLTPSEPVPGISFKFYFIAIAIVIAIAIGVGIIVRKKKNTNVSSSKEVIFSKIDKKFMVILFIILFEIVLIGALVVYYQNQILERQFFDAVLENEEDFFDLQEASITRLSATLEVVLNDESMRHLYLERDREKLFEYSYPLFSELKNEYGITHFYFIEPNGTSFVRLHDKSIFGDEIKRSSFLKAKETGLVSSGIELGKTTYALRVVAPYYDGDDLIGYVELAQGIDGFFDIMEKRKGDDFLMVADKGSLDEMDWASSRKSQGLRNNWDDFEEYVIVSSNSEKIFPCFSEENVELLRKKSSLLKISKLDDEVFACGGFSMVDVYNEKPAVIFSSINATKDYNIMINIRFVILFILFIVFSIFVGLGFYVSNRVSKPIAELNVVAQELRKKNFKARTNIDTGDELQTLGETLNSTAEALDRMEIEYKQLEKAKTEFLSITSHELRSPMTPMQAQLQMLLGEYYGKLTDEQKTAIEIVSRNTKRLDGIIVDFLEISRIEAARLKFKFVRDDPGKVVLQVIEEMKGFMPEKKITIIPSIEKLPIVEHDPNRLSQVLRNLINNAIKFSKEGSTVDVKAKLKGDMILFSVADHGIGIDAKSQQRLFEPFFQVEQTIYREYQGTGLGLAIVKGIVESQGGKVWLESVVGKGTTFNFTLPLKPTKEIKPIKLLFSIQENSKDKIKDLFVKMLGPMGKQEFELLEKKDKLFEKDLISYINDLTEKGILKEENGEVFKEAISSIFGSKENEK